MSVQKYPCADCPDCIAIGNGEGLCDYWDDLNKKFVVDLFDVYPYCPKPEEEEKK